MNFTITNRCLLLIIIINQQLFFEKQKNIDAVIDIYLLIIGKMKLTSCCLYNESFFYKYLANAVNYHLWLDAGEAKIVIT